MWSSLGREIRKQWEKCRLEQSRNISWTWTHWKRSLCRKDQEVLNIESITQMFRYHNWKLWEMFKWSGLWMWKGERDGTEVTEEITGCSKCSCCLIYTPQLHPGDTYGSGGGWGLPQAPASLHRRTFLVCKGMPVPGSGTLTTKSMFRSNAQRWQWEGDSQLLGSPEGPQQHQVPMAHPSLSPTVLCESHPQ